MAKFLPFVVEKSTPIYIFQTILSRSKGMNTILVASIFWLVLDKGIKAIRDDAAELPDSNTTALYEALISKYPNYYVSGEDHKSICGVSKYFEKNNDFSAELLEFSMIDIMTFLLVAKYAGNLDDYTKIPFDSLFDGVAENNHHNLDNYKLFSNDGIATYFRDISELRAFISYYTALSTESIPAVKAILGKPPARESKHYDDRADSDSDRGRARTSNSTFDSKYDQPRGANKQKSPNYKNYSEDKKSDYGFEYESKADSYRNKPAPTQPFPAKSKSKKGRRDET